jgi:hypothetical protein
MYVAENDVSILAQDKLAWFPSCGIGYYPVSTEPETVYNDDYFAHFASYEDTEMGQTINDYRVGLVNRFVGTGEVLDFGIGSGAFVKAREQTGAVTRGFDINPAGIEWLYERDLFVDPYKGITDHMTFWDTLEHVESPSRILKRIDQYVFISMPIYRDLDHLLRSKHFKPREHFWYFTVAGLKYYMAENGFECVFDGDGETKAGREDILTFVFRRSG